MGALTIPRDWTPTNEEYHAETTSWGSSMIRKFAENGASWAHAAYIAKTIERDKPTGSMEIGTAVHSLVLEPGTDSVRMVDVGARTAKAFKDARGEAPRGVLVLTRPEFETAAGIAGAILNPTTPSAKAARAALVDLEGESEVSYAWDYVLPSGRLVACKIRADRIVYAKDGTLLVPDLKTTADPGPAFMAHYQRFGYDLQAALYRAGIYDMTGADPVMACVAARNDAPFDVRFAKVGVEVLDLGRRKLEHWMERIADCQESGVWLADWEAQITEIEPTAWAESAFQREIAA